MINDEWYLAWIAPACPSSTCFLSFAFCSLSWEKILSNNINRLSLDFQWVWSRREPAGGQDVILLSLFLWSYQGLAVSPQESHCFSPDGFHFWFLLVSLTLLSLAQRALKVATAAFWLLLDCDINCHCLYTAPALTIVLLWTLLELVQFECVTFLTHTILLKKWGDKCTKLQLVEYPNGLSETRKWLCKCNRYIYFFQVYICTKMYSFSFEESVPLMTSSSYLPLKFQIHINSKPSLGYLLRTENELTLSLLSPVGFVTSAVHLWGGRFWCGVQSASWTIMELNLWP